MAKLSQCYSFIDVAIRRFARGQIVPTGQSVPVCVPMKMDRYLLWGARQGIINVDMFDIPDATSAATFLSMRLSALQLPESLHSDIVVRVYRVARDLIMGGHVRGSGMSMGVTIQATTMHQAIEHEYRHGIYDATMHQAIEHEYGDDIGVFDDFTDGYGIYDATMHQAIEHEYGDNVGVFGNFTDGHGIYDATMHQAIEHEYGDDVDVFDDFPDGHGIYDATMHQAIEHEYGDDVGVFNDFTDGHGIYDATMHQAIEHEYGDDVGVFDDFTDGHGIYDAIDQFGPVSESQSSTESLEKVRYEAPESESNTQTQCSICLEEFEAGSRVTRLPCLHVYHGGCIDQWMQKSHTCPLCRFSLPHIS